MSDYLTNLIGEPGKVYMLSTKIGTHTVLSEVKFIKIDGNLMIKASMGMSGCKVMSPIFKGKSKSPNLTNKLMEQEVHTIVEAYAEDVMPRLMAEHVFFNKMLMDPENEEKLNNMEAQFRKELSFEKLMTMGKINYIGNQREELIKRLGKV